MKKSGISGFTFSQYQELLQKQSGMCAVCHKPEQQRNRWGTFNSLAVDHDHQTGKVRGLLCAACNQGLGNFRDDVQLLRNAAYYLETSRC